MFFNSKIRQMICPSAFKSLSCASNINMVIQFVCYQVNANLIHKKYTVFPCCLKKNGGKEVRLLLCRVAIAIPPSHYTTTPVIGWSTGYASRKAFLFCEAFWPPHTTRQPICSRISSPRCVSLFARSNRAAAWRVLICSVQRDGLGPNLPRSNSA